VYDVKSVSLPETKSILENYYHLQIIEKGVAEQFLGLSQNEASPNLYFSEISLKRELSNDTTVIPPIFSLVNTFKSERELRGCWAQYGGCEASRWVKSKTRVYSTWRRPSDIYTIKGRALLPDIFNIILIGRRSYI
jgi:hypothetical protein